MTTTNISFDAAMLDKLSADTSIGVPSLIRLIDEHRVQHGHTTAESVALIRERLGVAPKAGV